MASVLRIGAGVRSSAGLFDRAFYGLSTTAALPHFAAVGVLNGSLEAASSSQVALATQAARSFASRGGTLGRSSPISAAAASASGPRRAAAPAARREVDSDSDSGSDSDDEPRGERGTTEFWRKKMRTFHSLIDLNNDGVVSFDDFTILAERFINLGHLTPAQQEEFKEALKVVWEDQWGKVHPYNLVTTQQYLDNMYHIINDKELSRKSHFLPHLFEALDQDHDDIITVDEFKMFFQCLGRTEEDAIKSYKIIDINGDGLLSLKEFVQLGHDYFTVEDENHPSTYFWGPLTHP